VQTVPFFFSFSLSEYYLDPNHRTRISLDHLKKQKRINSFDSEEQGALAQDLILFLKEVEFPVQKDWSYSN
jgi:hypothetical protein